MLPGLLLLAATALAPVLALAEVRIDPDAKGEGREEDSPPGRETGRELSADAEPADGGSSGATPDEPAPVDDVPTFETKVTAERPGPAPVAASDLLLDAAAFRGVPRRNASEILTLAPGVVLGNHHGEGHAAAVYLRGFDAGEGQDLEFRLEGIPLNEVSNPHGHGYADTNFIIPELVESVRMVEGPFDPSQGDFAVAGSVEYRLGLPERGARVQGGLGSHGANELLLLWGPADAPSGTFVGVSLRRGDGFGPNRAYTAGAAMAGLEHRLSHALSLRLVGMSHATRFDSAGVIRQDDFQAGRLPCGSDPDSQFYCSYDPGQGGEGSRHGLLASLSSSGQRQAFDQSVFFSVRRLRLVENFTGFLQDDPEQRGDAREQTYRVFTVGLRGSLVERRLTGELPQELEIGYLARYDDGDATARRLRRDGGVPYATTLDESLRITNLAAYAAARLRLTERIGLSGGVRVDSFFFDVTDRNRPSETRAGPREPVEEQGADGLAFEPRITGSYTLADGLDWIASWGVGVRSTDVAALSDGEFAPFAKVHAAETGLVHRRGRSEARLVGFVTRVDRDLVFDERQARNVFVGASSRYGALAAGRIGLPGWLDLQGSLTWAEAHLSPDGAGFFDLGAGPRLPYVPRWVARVDAIARRNLDLAGERLPASLAVGANWIGARPLPLGASSDAVATVDLGGRIRWGPLEAGLSLTNLLDTRYHAADFNYVSHFDGAGTPSRVATAHFAAAPPRMAMATLAWILDPTEGVP